MSPYLPSSRILSLLVVGGLSLFPSAEATVTRRATSSSYSCSEAYIPITATAQNVRFDASAPANQLEVAAIVSEFTAINSNYTASIVDKANATQTVSGTWKIYTKTCVPAKWNGNVQILTHGIAASHSYFEFPANKSLSYLDVAALEGNVVVNYDRLGVGKSDHPDGLHFVQLGLQGEILHQLVEHFKKDSRFTKAKEWIGVGHSYGSGLTSVVMAKYPTDFTKVVLTGYSPITSTYGPIVANAFSPTIAYEQNPALFSRYKNDTTYWVTQSAAHDLAGFFDGPPGLHYPTAVLDFFVATKGSFTAGEFLSMYTLGAILPANEFSGGILIVTGVHDAAGCGGNCYSGTNGGSALDSSTAVFPQGKISTYIPLNTAHAAFQHYTAPAVFGVINSWLGGKYE